MRAYHNYRDYGGPLDGMEKLFKQLDGMRLRGKIRSHTAASQEPTRSNPTPTTGDPGSGVNDAPSWSSDSAADYPREPVGPSKLATAAFASLGASKDLARTGFADAVSADRAAYVATVNRYASPALQSASPEFAAAAEADRAAHASLLSRYVSPALERGEGAMGAGLATSAAEFLGPLVLAEGITRAIDSIPADRQRYTPVWGGRIQC